MFFRVLSTPLEIPRSTKEEMFCFMSGGVIKMVNKLKSVAMLTVSKDICNLPGNFDSAVDETHMCAGVNEKEGGVCTDDKGGSLICSEDCKSLCL